MEEEIESWLNSNHSYDLDSFNFDLTPRDVVRDTFVILFTITGLLANIIIIYLIARNFRMRGKTNILLLNFAINDAFCLLSNVHFLVSVMQIAGAQKHTSANLNCAVQFMDVIFQLNQTIFLLVLITDTLMKNRRIRVKWLLVAVYISVVLNFLMDQLFCEYKVFPYLVITCAGLYLANLLVILCKEINNCYKKYYKKEALSKGSLFRLTIGRIYIASWFFSFILYESSKNLVSNTLANQCFITSAYLLIYIVKADKNFNIAFWNLAKCKQTGCYDLNPSVRYTDDSCDDEEDVKDAEDFNVNGNNNCFPIHDHTY